MKLKRSAVYIVNHVDTHKMCMSNLFKCILDYPKLSARLTVCSLNEAQESVCNRAIHHVKLLAG